MLKFGNKEFRNLQEQVYKNMVDIQDVMQGATVLADFGIKVIGQVAEASDLPNPAEYEGEYGDAYMVGTEAPYDFYIFTRAFEGQEEPSWFNLGIFPQPGPQGPQGEAGTPVFPTIRVASETTTTAAGTNAHVDVESTGSDSNPLFTFTFEIPQGAQGIQGPRGPQGTTGPMGPRGYINLLRPNANACVAIGEGYMDASGNLQLLVSLDPKEFENCGQIRGPQGIQGPQGERGLAGYMSILRATAEDCVELGEGYMNSSGYLMILTDLDPRTFTNCGQLRGPQGSRGPQGPTGYVNIIRPNAAACTELYDAYVDSNGNLQILTELPDTFTYGGRIKGDTGTAATIRVGTVATGDPGTDVIITNSGSSSAAVLNFTIPQGMPGEDVGINPVIPSGTPTSSLVAIKSGNDYYTVPQGETSLQFNVSLPAGETGTPVSTIKDGQNYYTIPTVPTIDNKTIVKNQQGQIETAIGGWKESVPTEITTLSMPWGTYGQYVQYLASVNYGTATTEQIAANYTAWMAYLNEKAGGETINITIMLSVDGSVWDEYAATASVYKTQYPRLRYFTCAALNLNSAGDFRIQNSLGQEFFNTGFQLVGPNQELYAYAKLKVIGPGSVVYHPINNSYINQDIVRGAELGQTALQPSALASYYNKTAIDDMIGAIPVVSGTNDGTNWTSITIGDITKNIPAGGSGSGAAWGQITGTLSNQTDLASALNNKQDTLVSGTSIKTINNQSLLGSGNIDIQGGSGAAWGQITGTLSNQTDLASALGGKQDTLVSGTSIKTINNQSLLGSGNIDIQGGGGEAKVFKEVKHNIELSATIEGMDGTFNFELYNYDETPIETLPALAEALNYRKASGTMSAMGMTAPFAVSDASYDEENDQITLGLAQLMDQEGVIVNSGTQSISSSDITSFEDTVVASEAAMSTLYAHYLALTKGGETEYYMLISSDDTAINTIAGLKANVGVRKCHHDGSHSGEALLIAEFNGVNYLLLGTSDDNNPLTVVDLTNASVSDEQTMPIATNIDQEYIYNLTLTAGSNSTPVKAYGFKYVAQVQPNPMLLSQISKFVADNGDGTCLTVLEISQDYTLFFSSGEAAKEPAGEAAYSNLMVIPTVPELPGYSASDVGKSLVVGSSGLTWGNAGGSGIQDVSASELNTIILAYLNNQPFDPSTVGIMYRVIIPGNGSTSTATATLESIFANITDDQFYALRNCVENGCVQMTFNGKPALKYDTEDASSIVTIKLNGLNNVLDSSI